VASRMLWAPLRFRNLTCLKRREVCGRRGSVSIAIGLSAILFAAISGYAADRAVVEQTRALLDEIDRGKNIISIEQKLKQAEQELDDYLRSADKDVDALILAARLGYLAGGRNPVVISQGQPPPNPKDVFRREHSYLDRALRLRRTSAEAHYWKARLYGLRMPIIANGILEMPIVDADQAVRHMREAVRHDPRRATYREALAIYLADAGKTKEAFEVAVPLAKERNPVYVLLKDLNGFPLPDKAIFAETLTQGFRDIQVGSGKIRNFPMLRVWMFALPMTVTEIDAFYRNRWPDFRLFQMDSRRPGNPNYGQFLKFDAKGMEPSTNKSDVDAAQREGILLSVLEFRHPPARVRQMLPIDLGPVYSILTFINLRLIQ